MSKVGKLSSQNRLDPLGKVAEVDDDNRKADHVTSPFLPWRVFVNQMDSYHGKKLADVSPDEIRSHILYDPGKSTEDDASGGEEKEEEERDEVEEEEKKSTGDGPEVGADEGINGGANAMTKQKMQPPRKYEVVGTVTDDEYSLPEDITMIITPDRNGDFFLNELMKCGVIIYDITQDPLQIAEAEWALEAVAEELKRRATDTPKAFKRNEEVRYFVLISPVMTWALSPPLYAEDPKLAFTEADYRKRRPHPNFEEHSRCEKNVATILKSYPELKDKLKTIVLCCGVTYGEEEGSLHYIFKMAWHNAPGLPIFGTGKNKIPLLHVRNIPKIVLMLLRDWPKLRYVVAVEHVRMSQRTIVKGISETLGTGKVKIVDPEEAFLTHDITQQSYDMATLNLNIEPGYLVDRNIEWHSELPFNMDVKNIVKEYKRARNLHPVKIVVLGPPASGKSRLAKTLAEHYRIHYINVKSLITETINKLTADIEEAKSRETNNVINDDDDDDDDDDEEELYKMDEEKPESVEIWEEELKEIRENLSKNNERLDDGVLNKILRKKLSSKECQNQGYVLDGYPKTLSQAKELFGVDGTEENEDDDDDKGDELGEEEEEEALGFNRKIMPELVVVLEASDEYLTERLLRLSEAEIQGTHYTEEHMIRRFREYRDRNTENETPLRFFDESEIHPVFISVEDDPCPEMFSSFNLCLKKIGKPRNYGLTPEETADIRRRNAAETRAGETAEKERKTVEELNRKTQREQKMMEWTNLLEKLKEEEENQLCIMGEPLRHYLVKYVFPTLTQGLVNVAELRPEDPVDYLAEYLFKENPEGKMFEPDYTETMSTLLAAIEEIQKDILPFDELDEGTEKYLKQTREASVRMRGESDDVMVDCPYYKRSSNSEITEVYDPKRETGSFGGEMQ